MNIGKMYGTDKELESDGIWLDFGEYRVKVARAGGANAKFQKVLEHKLRPHRRALQNESLDNTMAERIMHEVFAESVVIDWEGVKDDDGNDIPFSKTAVVEAFRTYPDFFKDISEHAGKAANFRQKELETDAKN